MIRIQIGGSPCTKWSISRMSDREVVPEGVGWELFLNYKIARDKYGPDFFLYENNKSMAKPIRAAITRELGVGPVLLNSSLVSGQNRERLYWVGRRNLDGTYGKLDITVPADRGILLRDVIFDAADVPDRYWYDKPFSLTGRKTGVVAVMDMPQWLDIMRRVYSPDSKSPTLNTVGAGNQQAKVLQAGRVRKLMPREYARLQTVPDGYAFPVSASQAYKLCGNGWTVDVIAHILGHFEGIRTGPVEVLSLYDGMACGRIALDKLGVAPARYYALEIDRYAIRTATANYPDIIQIGDAFGVRDAGWGIQ